jgi:hypothetical protein
LALLAISGFSNATANIQPVFAKIRSATERPPASALRTSSETTVKLTASLLKNQLATTPPALRRNSQSKHSRNYRQINQSTDDERYNRMANLASPRSSQHTTSLSMQSRRRDMPACRRIPLGPKDRLLVELGT